MFKTVIFNSDGYDQWIRPQVFYKVDIPNNILLLLTIIIKSWSNSLYCWLFMSLCDMVQYNTGTACWFTLHFVIRLNAHHNALGTKFSCRQICLRQHIVLSPIVLVTIAFRHQMCVSPQLSVTKCLCHQPFLSPAVSVTKWLSPSVGTPSWPVGFLKILLTELFFSLFSTVVKTLNGSKDSILSLGFRTIFS